MYRSRAYASRRRTCRVWGRPEGSINILPLGIAGHTQHACWGSTAQFKEGTLGPGGSSLLKLSQQGSLHCYTEV